MAEHRAFAAIESALDYLTATHGGQNGNLLFKRFHKISDDNRPFSDCKDAEVKTRGIKWQELTNENNADVDEEIFVNLPLVTLFEKEIKQFEEVVQRRSYDPQDKKLAVLMDYLNHMPESNDALQLGRLSHSNSETDVAIILVTHLLMKLVPNGNHLLDDKMSGREGEQIDCFCGCKAKVKFGDTGLGHPSVFHGQIDAVVGKIAVVLKTSEDDEDEEIDAKRFCPDSEIEAFIECKRDLERTVKLDHQAQAVAICVTNSFYQQKQQSSVLIPTILMSRKEFIVYLYDAENDYLLQSVPLKLFECQPKTLNLYSIIFLWCVLNSHLESLTSLSQLPSLKSGFHEIVHPEKLKCYKTMLKFGKIEVQKVSLDPILELRFLRSKPVYLAMKNGGTI